MRRTIVAGGVMATLALSAVAYGQAQVNRYGVSGSTSPTTAGTTKKPVPVTVKFAYTVDEKSGNRPEVIDGYSIFFGGLIARNDNKAVCAATFVTQQGSGESCPRGSTIGSGDIDATVGPSNDVTNQSIACHLYLTVYNGGRNRVTLFLQSGPTRPKPCPTVSNIGIDAKVVRHPGGSSLDFKVPANLLHPVPGLDGAVRTNVSTVRDFFASTGGCVKDKRSIRVTFAQEDGHKATTSGKANCSG